nr:MAG TPA: terminase small subunit [Caudoviricetes sp.]
MARPRKLLNAQSGNLTTAQREEREKEEEVLYNYDKLDFSFYPPGLLPQAFNEWNRIGTYVGDLPISELDVNTVIRYCNYNYLYGEVVERVAQEGAVDMETGKVNPLVNVMNSYSKELKSVTNDLGLTINSRLKITLPAEKEKEVLDPFAKMFEG